MSQVFAFFILLCSIITMVPADSNNSTTKNQDSKESSQMQKPDKFDGDYKSAGETNFNSGKIGSEKDEKESLPDIVPDKEGIDKAKKQKQKEPESKSPDSSSSGSSSSDSKDKTKEEPKHEQEHSNHDDHHHESSESKIEKSDRPKIAVMIPPQMLPQILAAKARKSHGQSSQPQIIPLGQQGQGQFPGAGAGPGMMGQQYPQYPSMGMGGMG